MIWRTGALVELRSTATLRRETMRPFRSTNAAEHFVPPKSIAKTWLTGKPFPLMFSVAAIQTLQATSTLGEQYLIEFCLVLYQSFAEHEDNCQDSNTDCSEARHKHSQTQSELLRDLPHSPGQQHASNQRDRKQ